MVAPFAGPLQVSQLFGGNQFSEAYPVVHGGITYHCIGHPGIDLICPVGTPILAMKDGIVRFFGLWPFGDDGYAPLGLHAVVTLPTGEQHWYAHLSQAVAPDGGAVAAGHTIARSGNTGNSTGPHLHVAVRPAAVNFANGYDGFEDFLPHFNASVYPLVDVSKV